MSLAISRRAHRAKFSSRKRVVKACDACRLKKSKCDGRKQCSRCIANGNFCVFTSRKPSSNKLYSASYVALLESRIKMLHQGLELLIQSINRGDNITFLLDECGKINIYTVLDNLCENSVEADMHAGIKRPTPSSAGVSTSGGYDGLFNESDEGKADSATKRRQELEDKLVEHSARSCSSKSQYISQDIPPFPVSSPNTLNFYPMCTTPSCSWCTEQPALMPSPAIKSPACTSHYQPLTQLISEYSTVQYLVPPLPAIDSLDTNPSLDKNTLCFNFISEKDDGVRQC